MLSLVLAVAFAFPLLIATLGLPSHRMISNAPPNIDARSVISPTPNVHTRDPVSLDVSNTSYDALINSTGVSYTLTCLTVPSDRFDFTISDPNDGSIAMIGILQEAPGGRTWEPFSRSSPKQWTYKSCSIALFPKSPDSRDTFTRLDIANAASILQAWCDNQRYGYRGGYMKFGFAGVFSVALFGVHNRLRRTSVLRPTT